MTNAIIRPPHETTSSGRVGNSTATMRPAARVVPTTAVPRASEPVSRSAATRTSVAPMNPRVVGVKPSGSRPPLACTRARRHVNAIASITARATRSAARARELDRRTSLPLREDVVRDALGHEVRAERSGYVGHGHDEDAVMRATERDRRVREPLTEPRRDDDERRAPRKTATLPEEHGLWRADRIRTEAREDLKAARERSGSASERGPRPLMREVVDAVGHEPDLAARGRGKTDQLRGGRDDELGGLRIGLDPVLLVRGDVDEEDRVEAGRRFVQLGLQLAESG